MINGGEDIIELQRWSLEKIHVDIKEIRFLGRGTELLLLGVPMEIIGGWVNMIGVEVSSLI